MIFLDANYLLRAIVAPATPQDQPKAAEAITLLRTMRDGDIEVTTSEAILAEVAFILTAPRHYGLSAAEATLRLRAILSESNFRLPQKSRYLRALDIWTANAHLGFVDALTVAYTERSSLELATFDAHFDAFTEISRHRPSAPPEPVD